MSRKITQEVSCDICGYLETSIGDELPDRFSELTLGSKSKRDETWHPFGPTFIVCTNCIDGSPAIGHDQIRRKTFLKMFGIKGTEK